MRYQIPGSGALNFPKCIPARLRPFGPWEAQDDAAGLILTAKDWPSSELGEPRKTPEGWTYWPSKETPSLVDLFRQKNVVDACNWVELTTGEHILIRPAYLEPRKLFTDGRMGDPITDHGRRARVVMELLDRKDPLGLTHPEALLLWTEAVGITYRATPEVIDDMPGFAAEDVDNIIAAVFAAPKPPPGAGTSPSPSPG